MSETLSVKAAARELELSVSSLYQLVQERAIAYERPSHGRIRFTPEAIETFRRRFTVDAIARVRPARRRRAQPVKNTRTADRRFELARLEAERRPR